MLPAASIDCSCACFWRTLQARNVRLAGSVVQLLMLLFPEAIDRLPPESSMTDGDLPIFLETNAENSPVNLFDGGSKVRKGGHLGCRRPFFLLL